MNIASFLPLRFPGSLAAPLRAVSPPLDQVLPARPRQADCLIRPTRPGSANERDGLLARIVQVPNLPKGSRDVLLRDLSAFPVPLLRLLARDDLLVVAVRSGQTLADTPRLPTVDRATYRRHTTVARQVVGEAVKDQAAARNARIQERVARGEDRVYVEAMETYWEARGLQELLSARLLEREIGFAVEQRREPFDLEQLSRSRGIPEEHRQDWEAFFRELNADLIHFQGQQATPLHGVALIPYAYHAGRPVSEVTLKQALELKAQRYKDAMGSHNWEERMVVLYEDYLADPAPEAGHHRVAIHEVGHALDHALERVIGYPELGNTHRKRVDRLYREDLAHFKAGDDRFTSHRARDSVREYFAEAVEAYLTIPMQDGQDYYKPTNNREDLQRLNPHLFAYLDWIFHLEFPADVKVREPEPAGLDPTPSEPSEA
ncbi:MAG: zinc-dependent peptidase [Candidatus Eremiobacterota bacterium]